MFSISPGFTAHSNSILNKQTFNKNPIVKNRKFHSEYKVDKEGNTRLHRFLFSLNNLEKNPNTKAKEIIYSKALIAVEPASLNHQNKQGLSPAFIATFKQRFSLIKQFLKMGADPSLTTHKTFLGDSLKLIDVALYHRHLDLSQLLHEYGEDIPSDLNPYQFFAKTTAHLESIFNHDFNESYWEHVKDNREDKDFSRNIRQGSKVFCSKFSSFSFKAAQNPILMNKMNDFANYFYEVYGLKESLYRGDTIVSTPMGGEILQENYTQIKKLSEEKGWNALIEQEVVSLESPKMVKVVQSYCRTARLGNVDLENEPKLKLTPIRTIFFENMVKLLESNYASGITLISEFLRSMDQNSQVDILSTISLIKMLNLNKIDLSLCLCEIYYENERNLQKGKDVAVRKESLSLLLDYLSEQNLIFYTNKYWGPVSEQAKLCLAELLKHL
ncbi:MAG: hypothetical protein Q8K60_06355 [Parachlamydiaceae bacterium]|nr:hypothetical protein [Parachlamydiaceae bacterium]